MLTAALDGLVDRYGLDGERLGEVAGGAVLKHSRDLNLTREIVLGTQARPRDAGLRRRPGLRDRPRDGDPGRQQDRARPDRQRHRLRRRHHLRRPDRAQRRPPRDPARGQPAALEPRPASSAAGQASGPASSIPEIPAQRASRAPASRWASTRAIMATRVGDHPRSAGRADRRQPPEPRRRLRARLRRTTCHPLPRRSSATEPAPRLDASRSSAKLKPVFGGADGHDDRRQLDAAQRRRLRGAAGHRGVGEGARPDRRCARFVDAETAAVDHVTAREGLLMAPAYAVPRLLDRATA